MVHLCHKITANDGMRESRAEIIRQLPTDVDPDFEDPARDWNDVRETFIKDFVEDILGDVLLRKL